MTKKLFVALAASTAVLAACDSDSDSSPATQAYLTPDKPAKAIQEVDAPISQLISAGEHCFNDAVHAVAAQLRAARAIDRDNAGAQRHYDQTGELMPVPTQVSEVSSNCYTVGPTTLDHPR